MFYFLDDFVTSSKNQLLLPELLYVTEADSPFMKAFCVKSRLKNVLAQSPSISVCSRGVDVNISHLDLMLVTFSSLHKFFCLLSHPAAVKLMVSVNHLFNSPFFKISVTQNKGSLCRTWLMCRDPPPDGRLGKGGLM